MKKQLFIAIMIAAAPLAATAAEIQYAVFAPDMSKSVEIADVATPFQFFTPYDDYVSGFDIWVDNPGGSGSASFGLRDENDTLLEAKTVTIPKISEMWGGQRFHVAFDDPVHVSSTKSYKIKMLSSMPNLRIYYADLANLQQHTSAYVLEKTVQPAYLGTIEQAFAFKFALYEDEQDMNTPVISQVIETLDAPTQVTIAFNANEPVEYGVVAAKIGDAYPPGPSFSGSYTHCQEGVKQCEVTLAALLPDTSYNYKLVAQDVWGNQSSYEGIFVTDEVWFEENTGTSTATSTPPVSPADITISNVQIVTLEPRKVEVAWTTNVPGNSSMLLEISDANGIRPFASFGDDTFELEHFLSSGNILVPQKQYIVSLLSFDAGGKLASYEFQFATPAESTPPPPPPPPPPPDDDDENDGDTSTSTATSTSESSSEGDDEEEEVTVQVVTSTGGSSATFTWGGGSSGGYRIDLFNTDGNAPVRVSSVTSATGMARINELDPGNYYAIVYENEDGVFKKVSPPVEMTIEQPTQTSALDGYQLPIIIGGAVVLAALIGTAVMLRKKRKHYYRP